MYIGKFSRHHRGNYWRHASHKTAANQPTPFQKRMHKRFQKKFVNALNLTTHQQTQAEAILAKYMTQMHTFRMENRKEFKSLKKKMLAEMETILSDDQKIKFRERQEKYKEHRRKKRGH
jgi:hypothetical protein